MVLNEEAGAAVLTPRADVTGEELAAVEAT